MLISYFELEYLPARVELAANLTAKGLLISMRADMTVEMIIFAEYTGTIWAV